MAIGLIYKTQRKYLKKGKLTESVSVEKRMENKEIIENGLGVVGIEFGSTRIKSVLIDDKGTVLASGDFTWENSLVDGIWTYDIELIHKGLRESYNSLVVHII